MYRKNEEVLFNKRAINKVRNMDSRKTQLRIATRLSNGGYYVWKAFCNKWTSLSLINFKKSLKLSKMSEIKLTLIFLVARVS